MQSLTRTVFLALLTNFVLAAPQGATDTVTTGSDAASSGVATATGTATASSSIFTETGTATFSSGIATGTSHPAPPTVVALALEEIVAAYLRPHSNGTATSHPGSSATGSFPPIKTGTAGSGNDTGSVFTETPTGSISIVAGTSTRSFSSGFATGTARPKPPTEVAIALEKILAAYLRPHSTATSTATGTIPSTVIATGTPSTVGTNETGIPSSVVFSGTDVASSPVISVTTDIASSPVITVTATASGGKASSTGVDSDARAVALALEEILLVYFKQARGSGSAPTSTFATGGSTATSTFSSVETVIPSSGVTVVSAATSV